MTQDRFASYTNYRYWPEMLSAGFLRPEWADAIIDGSHNPDLTIVDCSAGVEVLEKPTPTEAEQRLIVPGLRAGHYLCFFGMHVLTPTVMDLLEEASVVGPGDGAKPREVLIKSEEVNPLENHIDSFKLLISFAGSGNYFLEFSVLR